MFLRLGNFISRYWLLTILFWVALVVFVRRTTPQWDSVTLDGDLAYMPASMPSVQGELLLEKAFPDGRAKSKAVIVLSRTDHAIDQSDLRVVRSLVCRFQNLLGTSCYAKSRRLQTEALAASNAGEVDRGNKLGDAARKQREDAVQAFEAAVAALERQDEERPDAFFSVAAHNLAIVYEEAGLESEAEGLRNVAWSMDPALQASANTIMGGNQELPLIDVWSRYTSPFGDKLVSKRNGGADLILLRLSNEFMAVQNIPLIQTIEETLEASRSSLAWPEGLQYGLSGDATIGSDILRSSKESIKNTEWYTVVLVVVILLVVYRSPLLVAVPLVSIVVSLLVATGLVAQLTTLDQLPGMAWWNFKIFTTTKIFVVVILFGAGTDYCLFLIARYREELETGKGKSQALAASLSGVGEALAASAMTTILGLGTMYWAQFGKFRNSGPAIGLCLFVTLLACVTLAPALLRAMGSWVYWSFRFPGFQSKRRGVKSSRRPQGPSRFWLRIADLILKRPAMVLATCTVLMLPFFVLGFNVVITYDLLSELDPSRISKRGARLLRQHFELGESGPIVVLAQKPGGDLSSTEGIAAIRELTGDLYVDGVTSVRSLVAPTGKRSRGISLTKLAKQNHRVTREIFLSQEETLDGDVARFELVLGHDPFSIEATRVLQDIDRSLSLIGDDKSSFWSGSRFVFAGTTAAIRDLRQVTSSDNSRIQILVVLAVLIILLILLRRPAVCCYLILSVLFSYYVTIGATQLYFSWLYGPTFQGLDWKVPLFLFVILVAIGQDYNIYLATRVFEEQKLHGLFGGLRQAIVRTGGIITSCGVIMAGTFLSMMSGSMRGIVELGFALTLGVLLDTFVVRPILVPAFLALLFRWHSATTVAAAGRRS